MIGRRLAHYEIEEGLGHGGMGVVYRARDTRLKRQVALKVLAPQLVENPELRRRLLTEARAAAALQHPSITVVYEIDEADGVAFIAMELIRGESLQTRVRDGSLQGRAALGVAVELAEALAEAHRHGVVHRDLKPSNVMITEAGHAKVIDFGLAKVLESPRVIDSGSETPPLDDTDPGRLVGTAAYMSPEQVRGEGVDPRSDIFCYGSLLLELLGGKSPFKRPSAIETLHAVLKDPSPRLPRGGLPDDVLGELQRVLDKCLAKDPEQRYQNAADLIVDLRTAVSLLDTPAAGAAPRSGPLRVVIVDDEAPARDLLRELLAPTGVEIVAECSNGFEAVKRIADTEPDLVFLDIQMPKLDGFEVLELIGPNVAVVFQTAYDEHAVRAFQVNAIDYLLKPVDDERVRGAVDRVRSRLAMGPIVTPVQELIEAARPREAPIERVLVREGSDIHVIQTSEIDFIEAQDDYVSLHTSGREHLKQETLQKLETQLDATRFVRIHRSYLVNVDRLVRIESDAKDKRFALLRDGTRLPVSRSGYARLKEFL